MKFTITREQLQEGLSGVAAAIPAKTTLPVLANVLVEVTKQGLRLSGTDLDIAVTTTVPAEVDAEGAVTLPAKKLVDIARELPSGPVRFTAAGESRVAIECGRSKFKLLGLPREEFPSFPAVKFDGAWNAEAGVVRSEEHTSELQSHSDLVCRLLLEKKKKNLRLASAAEETS